MNVTTLCFFSFFFFSCLKVSYLDIVWFLCPLKLHLPFVTAFLSFNSTMPAITPAEGHLAETVDEKTDDSILATAEEANDNAEDTPAYHEGWALWNLGAALMGSAFLLSLDNTILGMYSSLRLRKANLTNIQATAIPRITSEFNSLNDIGWYASAYKITQMALLPLCGRIYTFYDNRWSYIIVLLIFELGSIICAVAQNSTTLIVGRAVSGVGAAGLMSGAAIIISATVALRKRPVLMGLISIIYGVASVLGPLVGGVITDSSMLTWRFCFWINLRRSIAMLSPPCANKL
jgi:hypothetical protein